MEFEEKWRESLPTLETFKKNTFEKRRLWTIFKGAKYCTCLFLALFEIIEWNILALNDMLNSGCSRKMQFAT